MVHVCGHVSDQLRETNVDQFAVLFWYITFWSSSETSTKLSLIWSHVTLVWVLIHHRLLSQTTIDYSTVSFRYLLKPKAQIRIKENDVFNVPSVMSHYTTPVKEHQSRFRCWSTLEDLSAGLLEIVVTQLTTHASSMWYICSGDKKT